MDGTAILFGLGLGLRHATDADHIVAVSMLLERESSLRRAAGVAALWGLGHTSSFLALGLLVVLGGLRPPERFEVVTDVLVGVMLVGMGLKHLWQTVAPARRTATATSVAGPRSVAIGLIHGLAGSAGIALVATTTIASPRGAIFYLLLFGLGTVAGMVAATALISWSLSRVTGDKQPLHRLWRGVAAVLSVLLGLGILLEL